MICVNSVEVSPKSVVIEAGKWYYYAYASVCPANADCKSVTWHSSNTSVASVNPTTGYIRGVSQGTARIYATATDGSGCSDYLTVTVKNTVAVSSVTLDRSSVSVEKGSSVTLCAIVCPENATNKNVNWSSSNNSVATVSGGVVTAVSNGSARITATAADGSGKSASCWVSVTGDVLVSSIELTPSNTTLRVGYSLYPSVTVCPINATNKSVTWSSANSNIASVNPNSGLIYAKAVGVTTIYAHACDGSGVCGCCTVRVVPVYIQDITVCPETLALNIGECACLDASVYPVNATNPNISWVSNDCNIADVDSNGCVTAKSAGTTCICAYATDGSGVHGCCEVTCHIPNGIRSGTDSIGEFKTLSLFSAAPSGNEQQAPVLLGMQFKGPGCEGCYSVRFISQIKHLDYKCVGFEIHSKFGNNAAVVSNVLSSTVAYTSVLADGKKVYPDNGFKYLVVGVIENVPQNAEAHFEIVPFAITLDGEYVYGIGTPFHCQNAQKINSNNVVGTPTSLNASDIVRVNTSNANGLNVMSLPNESGTVLGQFANLEHLALAFNTPQYGKWYAVYGLTKSGTYKFGWCDGECLGKEVVFMEWNGSGNINVRSETDVSTEANIIGKLPPNGRVRLLQENYRTNSHTWHKISYANRDAYIADQPELSTKISCIPLIRKRVGGTLTNQDINRIVANVQNCSEISMSKRDVAASFAEILLKNNFEPTFVAGVLANLEKEGNIGKLENSNYRTYPNLKPDYLKYMDSQYNGLDYYLNNYSDKTIMDLGVNAVYNILLDLRNSSNKTWYINGSCVGFGIGSFQWTFERSWNLMIKYREQNNNVDTISSGQVINAERSMLIDELESKAYYDVLPFWEDQCTSYLNTVDAANRAGFTVCTHYLKPKDADQPQIRATLAEQIYTDMME